MANEPWIEWQNITPCLSAADMSKLDKLTFKVTVQACPRCLVIIRRNQPECHNCGQGISWDEESS